MRTLFIAVTFMSVSAFAEVNSYPCRSDDYYCQSKNAPIKSEKKVTKAKKLSDKVIPGKVEEPTRVETISETTGQGILRTY